MSGAQYRPDGSAAKEWDVRGGLHKQGSEARKRGRRAWPVMDTLCSRTSGPVVNVKVRSVALIKNLLGQGELDLAMAEGSTIDDLLMRLEAIGGERLAPYVRVPKEESAHAPLRIMVNGRDIAALAGRKTVLKDGDDILAFVPIAGG